MKLYNLCSLGVVHVCCLYLYDKLLNYFDVSKLPIGDCETIGSWIMYLPSSLLCCKVECGNVQKNSRLCVVELFELNAFKSWQHIQRTVVKSE
jgi:hypothetical protein